jgi:hypothetical protein
MRGRITFTAILLLSNLKIHIFPTPIPLLKLSLLPISYFIRCVNLSLAKYPPPPELPHTLLRPREDPLIFFPDSILLPLSVDPSCKLLPPLLIVPKVFIEEIVHPVTPHREGSDHGIFFLDLFLDETSSRNIHSGHSMEGLFDYRMVKDPL